MANSNGNALHMSMTDIAAAHVADIEAGAHGAAGDEEYLGPETSNAQQITRRFCVDFVGTLADFARDPHLTEQSLADVQVGVEANDRLIVAKTTLVSSQNTGPVPVAIMVAGTPIDPSFIQANTYGAAAVIGPHTVQPLLNNRVLYERGKEQGIDFDKVRRWDVHTEDSIAKSVLTRTAVSWNVANDSPIVAIAVQSPQHFNINPATLCQTKYFTVIDARIAQRCLDIAQTVVRDLPFQNVSDITVTMRRADGKQFDDLTGIVSEGEPGAAFKKSNALTSICRISAEFEQQYVIWKVAP